MTCQLILMRHAKSDHDDPSPSDHDRELAMRGRRDTPRMAAWLAEEDCIPDRILSSSSVRTAQTAQLLIETWGQKPTVCFIESLYLANPETILEAIRKENGGAARLMILAHNPGMSMLTSILSNRAIEMPTAAVAIFDVAGPVSAVGLNAGAATPTWHPLDRLGKQSDCVLTHFASPKTIPN
jgi:phosphohistidine phosphatase